MNENDQKRFEEQAKELFDRHVEDLDAATRSKLNRARQRALAQLERPWVSRLHVPVPQAAAAALAIAVVGSFLLMRGGVETDVVTPDFSVASDIEILLAEDDMAFLEEIEFYAWLEAQPEFEGLEDTPEGAG